MKATNAFAVVLAVATITLSGCSGMSAYDNDRTPRESGPTASPMAGAPEQPGGVKSDRDK